MCLSAEVDLVAGIVVGAAGVDALRHTENRRERPVAALAVVIGAHQLVEAVAWWGLEGRVPEVAGEIAVWGYLLVEFGLLPAYVPAAVARLETDVCTELIGPRRQVMQCALFTLAVAPLHHQPGTQRQRRRQGLAGTDAIGLRRRVAAADLLAPGH